MKSFENFVVKLQNGWMTLRNPVSVLNSTTNDGEPAPAVETPSTSEVTFSA